MENAIPLSLSTAAWFFVGQSDGTGAPCQVAIKAPFRVGRGSEADLTLPSRSVSGLHAEILEEDGELWLHDLNSTNGTFVNGKRIESKVRLRNGDTVQFAAIVFHINFSEQHITQNNSDVRTPEDAHDKAVESLQTVQFERLFSGGVVPFFQPIVRIDQGTPSIAGFEVLGRSRLFGLRTPAQMFAAASRLQMEAELSRVLRRQGIELAETCLPHSLSLFVNTHPAELQSPDLLDSLRELRDTCPNRSIVLEVHESVLNETDKILELHAALKDLGFSLAFDDFGSGQARLFELIEVTPDIIKFDTKLVQAIHKAPVKRQHFVTSLVKMVIELGITPLAECVEDQEEHEMLRELGFQLSQGFYYGKPSSLPDCLEMLPKSNTLTSKKTQETTPGPLVQTFLETNQPPSAGSTIGQAEQWLLDQPANCYTIQLLSAISKKRAEEYVASQDNPKDFAIFCKPGKTRMLYIVVYGIFDDRAAAKAATAKLESNAVSPWIRMLSGVHAEIRNSQNS